MEFDLSISEQSLDVIRVRAKLSCPVDGQFLKSSNRIEILNIIERIELLIVDEISSGQIVDDGVPVIVLLLSVLCLQKSLSNNLFLLFSKKVFLLFWLIEWSP